jgi:hypothetical protein
MPFSTFSGPLRAGPNKEGSARNTGLVVLAQSWDSGDLTNRVVGNTDTAVFRLPQGAQIVDITVDQTVAATAGTTTISVGNASGGAQLMAAVATTAGGRFAGTTTAATQAAWQTSTTADTVVWVRVAVGTATLTAGRAIVTVQYVQRLEDGSQNPVSSL